MENGKSTSGPKPPKLLDRVRSWIRRFVIFHHKQHPAEMGDPEVQQFLTDLAEKQSVSASTQNQAAKRFGVPLSGSTPIAASKAEVQLCFETHARRSPAGRRPVVWIWP